MAMDINKAADLMKDLTLLGYKPVIDLLDDGINYKITVADRDGVLANTLKNFQDSKAVTCRARVIDIT